MNPCYFCSAECDIYSPRLEIFICADCYNKLLTLESNHVLRVGSLDRNTNVRRHTESPTTTGAPVTETKQGDFVIRGNVVVLDTQENRKERPRNNKVPNSNRVESKSLTDFLESEKRRKEALASLFQKKD